MAKNGEKLETLGLKREKGYLYYINKEGDLWKVAARDKTKKAIVKPLGIKKDDGYLYYLDKDGDISKSKMVSGNRRPPTGKKPAKKSPAKKVIKKSAAKKPAKKSPSKKSKK